MTGPDMIAKLLMILRKMRELSGIEEKTALVKAGLEALIAREAGKRLAALGGSDPELKEIPRRRSHTA